MSDPFEPVQDPGEALWLIQAVEPHWARAQNANYAAAVIPNGFAAYARIFHPAVGADGQEVTWATVAKQHSLQAHGQMQWPAITQPAASTGQMAFGEPVTGSLPQNQAKVLVDLLRSHTSTPERCYFAIWDGWGSFSSGELWGATARLHLPDRSYYLMRGTIDAATKSVSPTYWQSPSLWWPSDRAWCVATEVDLMSTYVGGPADCIKHILAHPRLEAWPASRDDRIDVQGDTVNRQSSKKRGNQ